MTRINGNIPPRKLTDQHLIAEHHEIIRICTLYEKRKGQLAPECFQPFKLGGGHVLFFLNKGLFTLDRYKALYNELLRRKFKATDYSRWWNCYAPEHMLGWQATEADNDIIRKRIIERILASNQTPRYNSKSITKQKAISLCKQQLKTL